MNKQMSSALAQGDNTSVVLIGASGENTLITKEVEFLGDSLLVVKDEESHKIYTGVGYVCKGLGLSEGQLKSERKKIQEDIVLSKGGRNFILPTNGGNQEVLAIELDYLPIWLAKISITPKMKEQQPELVNRLVEYQLKAKDVLANAFIHKQQPRRLTPQEELRLHYQVIEEHAKEIESVRGEVTEVREEFKDLKDNMPLFQSDAKEIRKKVQRVGTGILGGYKSNAYNDNSLRNRVYKDIYSQLHREFGVQTYDAIKRCQLDIAMEIIQNYKAPRVMLTEISNLNNQMRLD